MAVEVTMPQLSDTMEEGTLIKWHVQEGDQVEMGDVLAEIETDKATMDLEAFDQGTLLKILVDEGESVPTQELVAVIGEEGEDISDLLSGDGETEESGSEEESEPEPADEADEESKDETAVEEPDESGEPEEPDATDEPPEEAEPSEEPKSDEEAEPDEEPEAPPEPTEPAPVDEEPSGTSDSAQPSTDTLRASPVARRMAARHGVDLRTIDGSGPEGRVVKRDVEQALQTSTDGRARTTGPAGGAISLDSKLKDGKQSLSGMRKVIASRMTESKQNTPHFYLERDLDVTGLLDLRSQLNAEREEDETFSLNDLLLAAVARSLTQHPRMNASFEGDHIQYYDSVDLGFAVAVEDGLYTPVIRQAEQQPLDQIRVQSRELIQRALDGELTPDEYQGGTFTVSNLGMFDITNFAAVINPPEAGILAVGTVREEPVVEDGNLTVGKRMAVTLAGDHRVIDGAIGARYLQTFARFIEQPYRLLT